MFYIRTIFLCGATIGFYEFYKNNPKNKYVRLIHLHIDKSINLCPFLKKLLKSS